VSTDSPSPPTSAPPYPRAEIRDLHRIAEWQDELPWQPFGIGVEIHRLYGDPETGPSAVLLRYRHASQVRVHEHTGYEHILVLAGSQTDQNGTAPAGTLVINPPGTRHGIVSESGCIVLVIYEKPVVFLQSA
jgi:anti-sigma factor ChrR (cupin superfamily)